MEHKHYALRNVHDDEKLAIHDDEKLASLFFDHMSAMTAEGLHRKSDIAAELAFRDREIEKLKKHHQWSDEFPKRDGDFYYSGKLPNGREFVGIIQTGTSPDIGERFACVLIPPGWRGNKEQKAEVVFGKVEEWTGQFAGPEHGLNCVECR